MMANKIYYIWPADEDESDAIQVEAFDPSRAVEEACVWFWTENDGWEWMKDGCDFVCRHPDGVIETFIVFIELEPQFYARRK